MVRSKVRVMLKLHEGETRNVSSISNIHSRQATGTFSQ